MYKAGTLIAIAISLLSIMQVTSCDTELDLIDQTPDLPVVWGFIDAGDSVYQVRLQKSFSGKGNALDMARIYDSIYFDKISVSMELRYAPDKHLVGIAAGHNWYGQWDMAGDLIHRVRLVPAAEGSKEPGVFNNSPYRIFQATSDSFRIRGKVFQTDPGGWVLPQGQGFIVRLCIEDPKTGQTTVAATPFVDLPNIRLPRKAFTLNLYSDDPTKIIWQDHGWVYDTQVKFYYYEYTDREVLKYVSWRITGINRTRVEGVSQEFYSYMATPFQESLLGHVRAEIQQDPDVVRRKFSHIDYFITAAPGFVKDYLETYTISADHSGQAVSNVTNGYGLFAIVATNGREGFGLDPRSLDS
ncbi:MAG: hypothetical protein NTV01_13040, partial [Bacteroidia bacterium]|nr:hypothetical protein [Bacteroidia bacterium]